jgi:antitoxin ParD1/3/4
VGEENAMSNVEKISIALPAEMTALIKEAVRGGEYASSSEVIRDALRAWKYERMAREAAMAELRTEIQKGFESGHGNGLSADEFIQRAKARWNNKK